MAEGSSEEFAITMRGYDRTQVDQRIKALSRQLGDARREVASLDQRAMTLAGELADGTYTATGDGPEGPMEVEVTVEGGELTGFEVVSNNETAAIGGATIPELTEQVVAAGGPNLDGVSGATLTSNRIRDAVADCLDQAAQA